MLLPELSVVCGETLQSLKDLREGMTVSGGVGWGEMGTSVIQDIFVQYDHKGPLLTIKTARGSELHCSPDHPCFGRLNSLSRHYSLYLLERSTLGFRVGMSQDLMKDLLAMPNLRPSETDQGQVVDRLWIIETTESLPKIVFLTTFASCKYGLPNIPFSAKQLNNEMTDELIRELYNRIDTPSRARQFLMDSVMFEEFPHITLRHAKSGQIASSAIQFVLFGATDRSRETGRYSHVIRIDGSVELKNSDGRQFKRRMNAHGAWNLEVTRDDIEEATLFVKTLSCLDNLEVVKKIQLTRKNPFYLLPASHLKAGMVVPVHGRQGIEEDIVISISMEQYQGPLFDLKVEGINNFVAGNVVVMGFAGHGRKSPLRDLE